MNKKQKQPIGIFDSGVGGLTVAKAIHQLLPNENIIYFGDSVHLPYGNKSEDTIRTYSIANCRFLLSKKVKCIVIACNTSTAIALPDIIKEFPVPVIGVIVPGSQEGLRNSKTKKIGVIGTTRTVKSHSYSKHIKAMLPSAEVYEKACPLLVPIIEHAPSNPAILQLALEEYISPLIGKIDTLVLGCTHYPLVKNVISKRWPELKLIDSARATAKNVKDVLSQTDMLNSEETGEISIFTNDINEVFSEIAKRLFSKSQIILAEV